MKSLSLFELNETIKKTLDKHLEPSYWIVAEIGEMRTHQSGHCYLELIEKQEDKVIAKMRGTIWAYTYRNLSTWFENITGQPIKRGLKILCLVQVQFHELYGLSLNIKDIDATFTLGERARKRQETIIQLKEDGVYDLNKQLMLPVVTQHLAVISSPSAAGFGDFTDQLENNARGYGFNIKLFKALMQGEKAAESIIDALLSISEKENVYDAVVIIRGGGSQIDLDCFDNYDLAAHVAQFPLPILTGIGHDRDETITDLVAHTRLKTPTAVAEFLINGMMAYEDHLDMIFSKIHQIVTSTIHSNRQQLSGLRHRLSSASTRLLEKQYFNLQLIQKQLNTLPFNGINANRQKIEALEKAIELLNPENIFKRGYSFTTVEGKPVSTDTVKTGDKIKTYTNDLVITSEIEQIQTKHE